MSWGFVAAAVVSVGAGAYAANEQENAAHDASMSQQESADKGISEQRRQFESIKQLLSPYVNAGEKSLGSQQDLIGLNGNDAQRAAIQALEGSAQFTSLTQQGENAILQNASATGGLRGGNTQNALAQFRPQLLAQLINDQYGKLGGITSLGQNAAAGTGNAGMATGNAVTSLLQQQGAAQAGAELATGKANSQMASSVSNAFGKVAGRF
jgi:hypothetical protein